MRLRLLLVVAPALFSLNSMAQMGPLPVDGAVRTGKLDNGLTYYIRHNELPKGQAEFYIAQKVGSMQEEENQRGLAHFLEHMAFNGTTNFPDKALLEYFESVGAKFGNNINAGTGFDMTLYMLMNIPVSRQGIVDSAMLVLRDWSCGIALKDEEIDAERGIIHEEWRTRQGAQMRVLGQVLPVLMEGSRYGHRLPIGTMEVVDNFSYQQLRDYYAKWYRPDLQGVIVVGDIDVDYIETKIKDMFGPIAAAENPAERIYFPVPDNQAPIVAFATDRELSYAQTMILYKHDPIPFEMRNTPVFYMQKFMNDMVGAMMGSRLEELTTRAEPPFMAASVSNQNMLGITATKDALTGVSITDGGGVAKGFRALLTELRRADLHGFTAAEYQRAKADFLTRIETQYKERDKQRNNSYAMKYADSFLDFVPIPGIETEYEIYNQLVPMLPVEMINQYIRELISDNNIAIMVQGPDGEGILYPTKEEMLAILDEVSAATVEPYVEEVSTEPLVPALPKPGKVKKTAHQSAFDATVWTLSNGAKVVVKPTPYKDDEIRMLAVSPGGSSLIGPAYDTEALFLEDAIGLAGALGNISSIGGLGNFSATDLPKALAGKNASVSASVKETYETVSASASPRDLETMMQLAYLQFTAVRSDREAFASWKNRMDGFLRNMASNPQLVYFDSLIRTMHGHHPRAVLPSAEAVARIDYDKTMELFRARFADASNFTFIFVGNVDPVTLKPLVEQYIASLPSTRSKEMAGKEIPVVTGEVTNYFERTVEQPKVTLSYMATGIVEPTLKHRIEMDALRQVLYSRYLETLREGESGTYSPIVQGELSSDTGRAQVQVMVDTNADLYKRLGGIIVEEARKLAVDGPTDVELQKVREYMLKTDLQNRQENSFWVNRMQDYYLAGRDYSTGYAEAVNAMSKDDIRDFAKMLLGAGNIINVTMNGVAAK